MPISAPTLSLKCPAALLALSLLTGCSVGRVTPPSGAATSASLRGHVHGGQQPVSGTSIQLYAVGSAGNGSAATPLLATPVFTDGGGGFNISNDYTCPSATTQVYLTATGGNPGLPGTVDNGALSMMLALGDCGLLPGTPSISMDETTTAAAAWALAPFSTSATNIGASATNAAGLRNAMQTAMLLDDPTTATVPSPALPPNVTTEPAKILTLANILAACVNSDGSGPCSQLFGDVAGSPADTFQAALAIVKNPTYNVAAIFNDMPPQSPFAGGLTVAPNDWSLSYSITGGGLNQPDAVAVTSTGEVWVAGTTGHLAEFSPQGTPRWQYGVSGPVLADVIGVAVDASDNVWALNAASKPRFHQLGWVTEFDNNGQLVSKPYGYHDGVQSPTALTLAPDGSAWIANGATVEHMSAGGVNQSGAGWGASALANPSALALDAAQNVWVADSTTGAVVKMDPSGNVLQQVSCCATPDGLAIDPAGAIWASDSGQNAVTEVSSAGFVAGSLASSALSTPTALAIDPAGHLFVVNTASNSLAEFADSTTSQPGAQLSAASGIGIDAQLQQPYGVAIDASGILWTTSSVDSRLVGFLGVAAPTRTPKATTPQQP